MTPTAQGDPRSDAARSQAGLLAQRILTTLSKIPLPPPLPPGRGQEDCPPPYREGEDAAGALEGLIKALQCIRRGHAPLEALREPLQELAQMLPPRELQKASAQPIEAQLQHHPANPPPRHPPRFADLLGTLKTYLRNPGLENLLSLAAQVQAHLSLPCTPHPQTLSQRERSEKTMLRLGAALGVLLPLVFIIGILYYRSIILALTSAAIVTLLWALVRKHGTKYANANLEILWQECGLEQQALAHIAGVPRISVFREQS